MDMSELVFAACYGVYVYMCVWTISATIYQNYFLHTLFFARNFCAKPLYFVETERYNLKNDM